MKYYIKYQYTEYLRHGYVQFFSNYQMPQHVNIKNKYTLFACRVLIKKLNKNFANIPQPTYHIYNE